MCLPLSPFFPFCFWLNLYQLSDTKLPLGFNNGKLQSQVNST